MAWTGCSLPATRARLGSLPTSSAYPRSTARVLVRRGYDDAESATTFLAGELPGHDPFLLGDCGKCVPTRPQGDRRRHADLRPRRLRRRRHLRDRARGARASASSAPTSAGICRAASRRATGSRAQTLARLADDGYGLVLTVDCGITAVEEVAAARRLASRSSSPTTTGRATSCRTAPSSPRGPRRYPFPELCGTGVVYKLAQALGGTIRSTRHLDLVALATIADVVPLVDENRALAIAGLRQLARTQRPGLRALMRSARVDPAVVDEGAVGFRLAPRINAAGRLCRPETALELLLTEDDDEAGRLAAELEELNRERQAVEERILREASRRIDEWPESRRRQRGYVLADEDWHEGVIGIVASRLVERYQRPVVLIAGTDGEWKGSGRSMAAFDLHAGLTACAEHLDRFGGHRAAAGLSIRPGARSTRSPRRSPLTPTPI